MKIAIDGPAGSGKSTVAKLVASQLGFSYVDSGAMYRAIASQCLASKINLEDFDATAKVARDCNLRLEDNSKTVFIDDRDVSIDIRTPLVTKNTHWIASNERVREILVSKQREYGETSNIVMEGRDIQTVVLPDAEVKIFLIADATQRAQRRQKELEGKGTKIEFSEILQMVNERDEKDFTRKVGPLKKADDAVEIDTTNLSIEQVVQKIVALA